MSMRTLCGLGLALAIAVPGASRTEAPASRPETYLQVHGVDASNAALLDLFRKRTVAATKKGDVPALIGRLGDESFAVRERASLQLVELGPIAVADLQAALKHPDLETSTRAARCLEAINLRSDPRVPVAALQLLTMRKPPGATAVLLDFLPEARSWMMEEEIMQALEVLGADDASKPDSVLFQAAQSKESLLRQAAAAPLARSSSPAARKQARQLLRDLDPRVAWRAARALVAAADSQAVPALIDLVGAGPVELARESHELLRLVAGRDLPAIDLGGAAPEDRLKCRTAWDAWWQKHADKVDLSRAGWRLAAEPELVRLVERSLRIVRERMATNNGQDKHTARLAAVMIAVQAQTGPNGASSPLRATLRDQALHLAKLIGESRHAEAKAVLDALPYLTPQPRAQLGRLPMLDKEIGIDEVMYYSFGKRGGMGGIEFALNKLEASTQKEKALPAAALDDELWLRAVYITRVAQLIQEHKVHPNQGVKMTQVAWDRAAQNLLDTSRELASAVKAGNGVTARTALQKVNNACANCHDVFR